MIPLATRALAATDILYDVSELTPRFPLLGEHLPKFDVRIFSRVSVDGEILENFNRPVFHSGPGESLLRLQMIPLFQYFM
jgi:hypothetical protein